MNPPQPYPQQYPPPPYGGYQEGYLELNVPTTQKIEPASGFKDIWATGLWILNFAGFILVSVLSIRKESVEFEIRQIEVFGLAGLVGFVLSVVYLMIANIIKVYVAAVLFLISSVLYACCFWWWRDRIPFAKGSTRTGILIFMVFSFYWTSQVISYVMHVTVSGVFATYYFLNTQIAHPIWGCAKRAMTTSFGSICFGALLIAIINTIRFLVQMAKADSDSPVMSFLLCIVDCILSCIEDMMEWFNFYALSGVAIYGQGFVESAKRTWTMIKDRGIEALINDNLIDNVLMMGAVLVGTLATVLSYIYITIVKPAYFIGDTTLVLVISFIIGVSMFSTISTVISSGVATTFFCLAEDPEALRRSNPELYEQIRQTWPGVVQGI
ncbi:plasma-membrane choline transporter-domain-containing protein [Pilobolus umbonatus]|nr:plasma-membrane choline transporter-domain-containing protein [Pilobolus umbonatus]